VNFSRPLKCKSKHVIEIYITMLTLLITASAQSLPSPNGAYIATIFPSKLSLRETRSLEIIRVITLPPELAASIVWFLWSSTSNRILVGSPDLIRVYATNSPQFSASIASPTSGTTKATFIAFGSSDDEICVFSEFGLKLTIFNLKTSKAVDINSPKLYNPGVAGKGFSYRQRTSNLALLSRSGGKDVISVHAAESLEILRSWNPETIDAQGVTWSTDGKWIAVWDAAGQGHRLIVYTADGHPYKVWNGPIPITDEEQDIALGAGIRLVEWSQSGTHVAIGDYSRRVTLLSAPSFNESMTLLHTSAIKPSQTLQIWCEQIVPSQSGSFRKEFTLATQTICPPTSSISPAGEPSVRMGTNVIAFDNSGTLLVTKTEDMPTTVWIWDVGARTLRAVLVLHSPVAKLTWHPSINELLMVRCEGERSRGLVQLWDPSWESPKIIDFGTQLPEGKIIGKSVVRWLNVESPNPAILFSDSQDCILASLSESNEEVGVPWESAESRAFDIYGQREESPLNLVELDEKRPFRKITVEPSADEDAPWGSLSGDSDEVDDTFQFRKFVDP
jgi:WD40 repeat protein